MDEFFTRPGGATRSVGPAERQGRPRVSAAASRPRSRTGARPTSKAASARRRRASIRQAKRVIVAVLVGAATMLGVATLDAVADTTVPVLGAFAALPSPSGGGSDTEELPPPPTEPGTCLNWTRADAADTTVVDCAQPHLFEQAGTVTLDDQPTLPNDAGWRSLVNERCTPVVLQYLGGKYDPNGKFRIGGLKPSQKKWDDGIHEMRCGLQSASRSGALYPLVGKAAEQDQSGVYEAGTCLGIDGRRIGDPVDCAGPHAIETVGIVDLSTKFPDAFPAVGDQDNFLQPECTRIANEYAGGDTVVADKKLTVYWDNITDKSWAAGTRKVNCNVGALLPDRSGFAPVTGPLRGTVAVSDQPAPPATTAPQPGVPAPPTTSVAPTPEPSAEPSPAPPAPTTSPAPAPESPAPPPPSPAPVSPAPTIAPSPPAGT